MTILLIISHKAEARAKCKALNIMTKLGMPNGEWVTI